MTAPEPRRNQGQVFAEGEGDAWFARNRAGLAEFDKERDLPLRLLRLFEVSPRRILEVGSSSGARLAALRDEFEADVVGIDLSRNAVHEGRDRFDLDLRVQAAHELQVDGSFDLILLHFVLHWIDRSNLDAVIQRVDQHLAPGGLLLIGDFCPDAPTQVPYHHLEGEDVWTFKEDYAERFLQLGSYVQVGQLTGHHEGFTPRTGIAARDRIANWLLEKRG